MPPHARLPSLKRPKPDSEPLDWRSSPNPQPEPVGQHTYKNARRDASAKLCMPLEEPARRDALHSYFSQAPAVSDLNYPAGEAGPGILGGMGGITSSSSCFTCSSHETWRVLLIADYQLERELCRRARIATAARKSLGNVTLGTPGLSGFGGPSVSAVDDSCGGTGNGGAYGTAGQYNPGEADDGDGVQYNDAGKLVWLRSCLHR
jgi:hypothetical protein